MGYINPNSNGFLFTDHAISQKFICGVCKKLVDSVEPVQRTFDRTDACAECVIKINIGREQKREYLAGRAR